MADRKVKKGEKYPGWCGSCNQLQMHYRMYLPKERDAKPSTTSWYCGVCGAAHACLIPKNLLEKPNA